MEPTSEYSQTAIDHARNPRNMGVPESFDGYASLTGPCGDTMDFWIQVRDDRLTKVNFRTDGCGSSRACGSMATVLAEGKPLAAMIIFRDQDILDALGGFPPDSEHCALLAANGVKAACEEYFKALPVGKIARIVLVLSGKGGVGKSTIATNLAFLLRDRGLQVGLLDADIHGPSIPAMLGITAAKPERSGGALLPIEHKGIKAISIGMFLPQPDTALTWRGPRKGNVVRQFFREVDWGELDVLVVDSPPGTGDELLAVANAAGRIHGAVVITTPQAIAANDARRSVTFCMESGIPVLGVLENMNGFVCPKCGDATEIFPQGAGRAISAEMAVPFLGSLPIDPRIAASGDAGLPFSETHPDSSISTRLREIFAEVLESSVPHP